MVQPHADELRLMGRSVRSQHQIPVQVVRVGQAPGHVIARHQERVKVLLHRHHGAQSVHHGEQGIAAIGLKQRKINPNVEENEDKKKSSAVGYLEVSVNMAGDSILNDVKGMVLLSVKISS